MGIRASFSLGNCLVPPGSLTSPAWGRDPSPDVPPWAPIPIWSEDTLFSQVGDQTQEKRIRKKVNWVTSGLRRNPPYF